MYKHTTIFYPHIVKQYESVDAFVSENGYEEFRDANDVMLSEMGFDPADETKVKRALTDDGFEVVITLVYDSEAHFNEKQPIANDHHFEMKKPIFEEQFFGDSDMHL